MAAFPRHVLELTLQYLLPLNLPLPPHIISPPLLQRHHFLSIQPSDAAAYLLWPKNDGSSSDDTIGALDEIQLEDVNFEHIEALFTADADAVKAHVKLGGDLQVIFLHSPDTVGNVEWKYHDIARLPFPKKAFHNLDSAANYFAGLQNHGEEDVEEKESAAGFWDGYGSSPSASPNPGTNLDLNKVDEDDYWSSYPSQASPKIEPLPPINKVPKVTAATSNLNGDPSVVHLSVDDVLRNAIQSQFGLWSMTPAISSLSGKDRIRRFKDIVDIALDRL